MDETRKQKLIALGPDVLADAMLNLAVHSDAFFDQGLISFTDRGKIIISETLPIQSLPNLGICDSLQLRQISTRHHPYLAYHRERVFCGVGEIE